MLPTHLTSSTDGLCGLSIYYTPGTKRVKCGEATLVFYALLPVTTQWLKTHIHWLTVLLIINLAMARVDSLLRISLKSRPAHVLIWISASSSKLYVTGNCSSH